MWAAAAHLSAPVGTAGPDPAFLGVVANYRRRAKQGGTQFKRNLFFCWFVLPFFLKNVLNLFEVLHLKKTNLLMLWHAMQFHIVHIVYKLDKTQTIAKI